MKLTIEQSLQQAVSAHEKGKLKDAERLYRAILQSQPNHPDASHNLGILAVSVNKADEALTLFKTALEANPKIEQFWLSYIGALIKEHQFENARHVLKRAKKRGLGGERLISLEAQLASKNRNHNTTNVRPPQELLNSLLGHYQKGQFKDAEKLATSIIDEFSSHNFSWKILGAIFKATGRNSEAVSAYQKAVTLSPQDAEAHSNLGNTLQELGRLDEAVASFKRAIALKPDFAEAYYNLGITLQELGRLDEAEAGYIKATALKSDFAEAHYNLGNTLKGLGRLDEALCSYNQAIALKSDYAEAHYNSGNTLKELGRFDEAPASYMEAIALKPDFIEAHYNLGSTLKKQGRLDEALASYKQAIALKPELAKAHSDLGGTLKELGRLDEAEASYNQAIALRPDYAEAYSNLGVTLQELGRLDGAEASCSQAIALRPDFAEAHYNLGNTLKELGRLDEAEASYTQAIALTPDFAKAHSNLGNVLKEQGRLDEALASCAQAIALKPELAKAHSNLGVTLKECGRLHEAVDSYCQAIALKPDYAEAHSNLGTTLQELGRLDEAEASYKQAIALKPDLALAHYGLGIVLYVMGNKDIALKSILKANEIEPQSKDYELLLSVIAARESRKDNEAAASDAGNMAALKGLVSNPLILNRAVKPELITSLYEMDSIQLDKTKRGGLLASGKNDARYGNGIVSPDFNLFKDSRLTIQKLAQDLKKIMSEALSSDIYIYDSFFNILSAGGGTVPHVHLNTIDRIIGLNIGKQKYSLVYYLSVGDQNCREPGILKLYEPDEDILPCEGMITIIPASRRHSSVYSGKTDRVMVGVNFYSL